MTFRFSTDVPVRFRDVDLAGWVHNSVYPVYVEEGRIRYFRTVLGLEPDSTPTAIARQEIDYAVPIRLADPVTVRCRIARLGRTSLTFAFELETDDGVAAEGEVTQVLLDADGTPRSLPTDWRERIRAYENEPVEEA